MASTFVPFEIYGEKNRVRTRHRLGWKTQLSNKFEMLLRKQKCLILFLREQGIIPLCEMYALWAVTR